LLNRDFDFPFVHLRSDFLAFEEDSLTRICLVRSFNLGD